MDEEQSKAFVFEVNATRNLLAYGLLVITSDALTENTRDPIMTMLSSGLEKLYKLTLGIVALDRDGKWAKKAEMQGIGHKVGKMHPTVLDELDRRTSGGPRYIRELLDTVRGDPIIPVVIDCVDAYGREGRYFYLDALAGKTHSRSSPHESWRAIEAKVFDDVSAATQRLQAARARTDNEQSRDQNAVGDRIAQSVTDVWTLIAMCGIQHFLGETGAVFGREIHPRAVGRQ
ncbi:hypothetical protein ACMTN4_00025 (plasmid) [Rhodococcus globerulus]|uniref:hypothetical protein n=1 Tax=Rhodococcus globerulus TaxID=33008 RepID=UPI0039EBAEFC